MVSFPRRTAFRLDAEPAISLFRDVDPLQTPDIAVPDVLKVKRPRSTFRGPAERIEGPKPRNFVGQDIIESKRLEEEGLKVALGESTLSKLLGETQFRTVIDPDTGVETKVAEEEKKLVTIPELFTRLTESTATIETKLDEVKTAITAGAATSDAGKATIIAILTALFDPDDISDVQSVEVSRILGTMDISTAVPDSLPPIVGVDDWKDPAVRKPIGTFLLNTKGTAFDPRTPVIGVGGRPVQKRQITRTLAAGGTLVLATRTLRRAGEEKKGDPDDVKEETSPSSPESTPSVDEIRDAIQIAKAAEKRPTERVLRALVRHENTQERNALIKTLPREMRAQIQRAAQEHHKTDRPDEGGTRPADEIVVEVRRLGQGKAPEALIKDIAALANPQQRDDLKNMLNRQVDRERVEQEVAAGGVGFQLP